MENLYQVTRDLNENRGGYLKQRSAELVGSPQHCGGFFYVFKVAAAASHWRFADSHRCTFHPAR